MKRLLLLTALLMLTVSTSGCRCFDWLWRGSAYQPAATPVMMGDPCNPCNPCSTTAAPVSACAPCATGTDYVPAPGS